ncbi:hypothetical protein NP233_g9012 [Leucocoprinus birnbaumii]|uniref:Uncharacterized protein n=1 Tax=Leucocoprinus birnbaumii TaxID=56174 RepID=A0AAD5YML6_9AGAR|nr:hypothetical protein NP233_g9012 [Leucocoprinus birnbaumii]
MSENQYINERSFLYGSLLATLAYGVVATLSAICLLVLRQNRIPIRHRRAQFVYVLLLFTLSTLGLVFQVKITQAGFIEQRDFDDGTAGYGGPAAYLGKLFDHSTDPVFKGWMSCLVITNWFCDGILLWRCIVLYEDNRFWPKFFRFLPACLLTASFVTGILHLKQITAPDDSSWATSHFPFNFTILYGVVALFVNIILTTMITIRLYIHRRRAVRALGPGHGSDFTSVISMLIESAVLAEVFVIAFLVPYALRHWFCNIIIQPLIQVQAIAPLLIIYRVAQGKAMTSLPQHDNTGRSARSQSRHSTLSSLGLGSRPRLSGHRRTSSERPIVDASQNSSSNTSQAVSSMDQRPHRNLSPGFSRTHWDPECGYSYELVPTTSGDDELARPERRIIQNDLRSAPP